MKVVGLDLGRRNIKLYTSGKYVTFPSIVGEWRDIKLVNNYGEKAFQGVFNNEPYFAGVLAERESEFARQMLQEEKNTPDALLLALIALSQTNYTDFDIVTGLPINLHDEENKTAITNLLLGTHDIVVNGVHHTIKVHRVRVAVEAGGAYWSNPKDGLVRIIDGGSRTVNYITIEDGKYLDKDSGTLTFGFDTNKSSNLQQMANRIAGELGKKWSKHDQVYTVGGEAETLAVLLQPYYPNIDLLHGKKKVLVGSELVDLNLFSNAIGFHKIGVSVE